jgi:hypothetical protein
LSKERLQQELTNEDISPKMGTKQDSNSPLINTGNQLKTEFEQ